MHTIHITIENLVAKAGADAVIVSDNTGYRLQFSWDGEWEAYPVKTAVFAWHHGLMTYSTCVAFEGNTVAVPRLPAADLLKVGLMAGDIQTTTPAEIRCLSSILGSGGQEPEAPTESEYARIIELVSGKMEPVTGISVTESADGTLAMVNTLDNGMETIILTPDENGNPSRLSYNGKEIPISWAVSG